MARRKGISSARLAVSIPGRRGQVADRLITLAHQVCPYSRMTRDGIGTNVTLA